MITCFTGTPGGGKTYAAVLLLLDMIKKGRTIYTNMDGLDDESCRMALSLVSGVDREVLESRLFHLTKVSRAKVIPHPRGGGNSSLLPGWVVSHRLLLGLSFLLYDSPSSMMM